MSHQENKNEKKKNPVITVIAVLILVLAVAFSAFFTVKGTFNTLEAQAKEKASVLYAKELTEKKNAKKAPEEEKKEEKKTETEKAEEPEKTKKEAKPSDYMPAENKIDYSQECFYPNKRDTKLRWTDTVFSVIENVNAPKEAPVNTYPLSGRHFLSEKERQIDFRIYSYPETGTPAKITVWEDCGDNTRVTDFYYDKEKKLNYAADYNQINVVPVDITGKKISSRYYITDDTMVRYIYSEQSQSVSYELSKYKSYSAGTKKQYDYLEEDIINRAYITLSACENSKEYITLKGYVQDEFNQPVSGITVTLSSEYAGSGNQKTETDGDGYYSFSVEASDKSYTASFENEAFKPLTVKELKAEPGAGDYFIDTVYMGYTNNEGTSYPVNIHVRNAVDNGVTLAGAEYKLRNGVNERDAEIIASGLLDATGAAQVYLTAGMYTAEITAEGYETSYFTVKVKQDHQTEIGYAVPEVPEGSYIAYIYWETQPLDLDVRMIGQYGKNKIGPSADSIGVIMTETISLTDIGAEPYELYVSDYVSCASGNTMSYNMSASGVYAKVYSSEGLVASLTVPAAHAGVIWDVLTLQNGKVYPNNRYYYQVDPDLYWTTKGF
ncbi:MAG: carboxypeptidase regulatory-like domain-containing protein [Lachnospiraceae bacterium]|nr:carboxypeptidase regulatory-like domain-containing protein [Lachnospiraceae bacterium]